MKRLLMAVLVLALLVPMLVPGFAAADEARKSITYGSTINMNTDKEYYPTDFIKYFQDMINADIEFIQYDNDTQKLALASGDMPDLMMVNKAGTILDGKLAVAMDPYLEEYGQNILKFESRNAILRSLVSGGDGQLYFHTPNSGVEDETGSTSTWNGYLVRWDLYKELGAPAITNDDEYIEVLK